MSSTTMSGEDISAAAYALPPLGKLGGVGGLVQGFAIAYGVLSMIVLSVRVWVRAGFSDAAPTRFWGVEDFLTVGGTLLFIPAVIFAVYGAQFGIGSHDADLPSTLYMIRASEYQVYWELFYFVSSTMVKCAVGFTCTRLDRRKRITIPIYINMVIVVITAVLAVLYVFLNCRPFAATWNPSLGTCQKHISLTTVSIIVSAVQMCTDWICAVVPFFIVAGLQMSMRKKVSVVAILSLGLVASICTVVRMSYLKYYDTVAYPTEVMYHFGIINILSTSECALGTIGCSMPSMRKLFTHYFDSTVRSKYDTKLGSSRAFKSDSSGIKLSSFSFASGHGCTVTADKSASGQGRDKLNLDDSSQKGILVETNIAVSSSTHVSHV